MSKVRSWWLLAVSLCCVACLGLQSPADDKEKTVDPRLAKELAALVAANRAFQTETFSYISEAVKHEVLTRNNTSACAKQEGSNASSLRDRHKKASYKALREINDEWKSLKVSMEKLAVPETGRPVTAAQEAVMDDSLKAARKLVDWVGKTHGLLRDALQIDPKLKELATSYADAMPRSAGSVGEIVGKTVPGAVTVPCGLGTVH